MGERATGEAAHDYRALRDSAAAADLSAWTVLRLHGADTRAFLQGLATQDLESTQPGTAVLTLFLNEKGRPIALAWVEVAADGSGAWVISDPGARGTLRAHFERFRIMEDVSVEGPDGMPPLIGFAGPNRAVPLRQAASALPASTAIASERLSFLLLPPDQSPAALPAVAPAARFAGPSSFEAWRIAIGIPRTGVDFGEDRIATELSLPEAISLAKGCYVGQEVVARTSNRGQVRRQRVGFRFDWAGAPIPPRTEIRSGAVAVGYVTSAVPEPGTDQGIGMGYLSLDVLQRPVEVDAVDGVTTTHLRLGPWPL